MMEVMTEGEDILYEGHIIETEDGILHSEANPEVTIIQEGYTKDSYRNRGDSRQLRFRIQSRSPARRSSFASRSQSRDKDRCYNCREFSHFAKEHPEKKISLGKVQYREERIPKHKGCSQLLGK